MERFSCKTTMVSGKDALLVLQEKPWRKLLVVTEPGGGASSLVHQAVTAAGAQETVYLDTVLPEPTMQQAVEGSCRLKEFQPDLVVSVGGRNVTDCAKAMVCFSKVACRLAVIPTAFGSGSEMTDRVTLTHNGRRHLLQSCAMEPDYTILEPQAATSYTKEEIREGSFELLAGALEAYVSSKRGTLTDLFAREAFSAAWAALPAALTGNGQSCLRLQMASAQVGIAIGRTGLGLCRAMENALGDVFGISRGRAAAILLPALVGCNAHGAGCRIAELCRSAGLGGSREEIGIRNLRSGLIRLRRELGMPETLVQAGVDLRSVWSSGRKIVELTLEDPECRNNPVGVDDFLVRRILEAVTGRY